LALLDLVEELGGSPEAVEEQCILVEVRQEQVVPVLVEVVHMLEEEMVVQVHIHLLVELLPLVEVAEVFIMPWDQMEVPVL
jgi:hypothetical protein|tara:strand:- start:584 stop:826 length:243 start_codon:yes stop_codon:yes gene_type:complete